MLTAFRSVFPGGSAPDARRGWGSADVGAGEVGAVAYTLDGARSPLLPGVLARDLAGAAKLPVLFRVFATGSAGSAIFGGPLEGRDGRGSVAMVGEKYS